ncbi:MAG TPA: aminoglycoside 6-adenylyltransferase [Anaerolineales bacterium]|nr:aminoglycoside 6-adenylyltransferase [Anaerolineales bacterium]
MDAEETFDVIEHAIIQWAEARAEIRAVLLTSTRAVPGARVDVLSDYDVILIVQSIQPLVEDRTWINDFGEVLVVYWDPVYPDREFGIEMIANVTQYVDGLKIDFTLQPVSLFEKIVAAPALPAELDAGYRILLDKDQLTTSMLTPTGTAYIPKLPTREMYLTLINDFFSEAPYVAKCLWRDELLPAKWCLDYDMKHTYLRQLLEWRVAVDYGWSRSIGSLGKGLKKYLPPAIWIQFEETFVGAGSDDNWEALAKIMAFFRRVAVEVGERLGFEYPHAVHQRVSAYVEHIKQMKPSQHSAS